jgi:hypothetical protein
MKMLSNTMKKLPYIRSLITERDQLHDLVTSWKRHLRYVPPGHFYSPIPNLDEVRENESTIFGSTPEVIPGIDLAEASQLRLLDTFKTYYAELPFPAHKTPALRYFFENSSYSYSDAIILYCMIRHAQPKRIIEEANDILFVDSTHVSRINSDVNRILFEILPSLKSGVYVHFHDIFYPFEYPKEWVSWSTMAPPMTRSLQSV